MIMPQALPALKPFFRGIVSDLFVCDMLLRLIGAFIEHTGRMSASQAAGAVRTRAVHRAAVIRFLAKEGWSSDWRLLEQLAQRLLEQEERQGGTWIFIVDQTLVSQQGEQTENTFSTGNRKRRPRKGRRYRKYTLARKRCHCFVMGLLITPSGRRIPCCRFYYTKEFCQQTERAYRTQIERAAELIEGLPTPPTARVVVLGDTAFEAKTIREACAKRGFTWIVPLNPERVLAGPKPRPKVRSLAGELEASQLEAVRLQPGAGAGAAQRRLSRCRLGPKVKGRTFYVHAEKRAVHSVGEALLVFSTKELPKADQAVSIQKILLTNGLDLSAAQVVEWYDLRWQIELFFKELKSTLGFHQYRFRSFQEVEGWVQACLISFTYLEWYRSTRLKQRGLSAKDKRWWSGQRSYGLCQAVRQKSEAYDLGQLEKLSRTPAGRKKLRKALRAARPLEYRAAA